MHFGILGAGVIGLSTGLELQKQFPNSQITIIADKFNEETLSFGAAGIFRPGSSYSGSEKWIVDSYKHYNEILESEEASKAGVLQVSGYTFSSFKPDAVRNLLLEKLLPVYRPATEEELKICPGNFKYGSFSTTMVIDQSVFLSWAMDKFKDAGGKVVKRKVDCLTELKDQPFDAVFNCTGLSAGWLCNDKKVIPVRGQVFKVKAPWIKMFFYGDFDTYVIPGQNYVTMGGTRQFENYNESVNPHDAKGIWENCTSLVPSLQKATIVKEFAGLRPYRGEIRCELEEINIPETNKKLKVIHQYGHGGYGVTCAPGSAKHAVEILKNDLRGRNSFLSKL